ncbi:methylated-DNA--[protein]-cysteine S-methyltransferase [Patulibacter minatonensis]|uniref:methylated-DNA--[protein]-cysteine S-methyltransferase n=1 Tax=Patulibacter minatonensis TaxID=298163 RepID=UPI00047ABCE6|nr:methylated-DNA--[protein]-cysteine S-methyltransferase [Patulibacter minatonensis]
MSPQRWTTTDSPVGTITITGSPDGVSGLYMEDHRHRPALDEDAVRDDAAFTQVLAELREYFAGERTTFDVPIAFDRGTPFQRRVWAALVEIPYGETTTYGALAVRLGNPGGSRAVGLANGKNPVSIVVPCHRVVGSTGALTGYGGGTDRKRFLLDLERGDTLF